MKKNAVFLFWPLAYVMAGAAHANVDRCSVASSHVEQRGCLESMFREADKRLVQAEASTIAKIAAWDEASEYRSRSRKALVASKVAFRKFRSSQCDYAWSIAAGGNGATDMRLSCAIELTESRIKQLEASSIGLEQR